MSPSIKSTVTMALLASTVSGLSFTYPPTGLILADGDSVVASWDTNLSGQSAKMHLNCGKTADFGFRNTTGTSSPCSPQSIPLTIFRRRYPNLDQRRFLCYLSCKIQRNLRQQPILPRLRVRRFWGAAVRELLLGHTCQIRG